MRIDAGARLFSATDLLNFLGCDHASALDLAALSGTITEPADQDDAYLALLSEKGDQHEASYLDALKANGKSVREIPKRGPVNQNADLTRAAMRVGVDVIYQGALLNGQWHGYSDFLLKVDKPSKLGSWSYEVADTKLARSAKPKHVVQLCLYSQLVALEQELLPENAHVVLGDGTQFTFRVNDCIHYMEAARTRFEAFIKAYPSRTLGMTSPEPCAHCEMCRWKERCTAEWEKADHLSLVARLSGMQSRKLTAAGITTVKQLAELPPTATIPKIHADALVRIRSQARLQYGKRVTGKNEVEVLPLEARRGFARLPKPNEGDLFFDMEGDPVYSADGALEYLFGFHYVDDGKEQFKAFWARDRDSEKRAFEDALDFITARLTKYPDGFVYHYANYEQAALVKLARKYGTSKRKQDESIKQLAQMHGTRENEVDDLLRNRKLVDLYKVVREAIRVSEPAYSIKNLETFYAPERTEAIKSGGDSIVAFEAWLAGGDDKILKEIEAYNAFDCRSTKQCRDWLLKLRPDDATWFDPEAERNADEQQKEADRRAADRHILDLREALLDGVSDADRPWRELLGFLLEYHRREARREWWDFFRRMAASLEELIDDSECLAGLTVDRSVAPRPEKRSFIHTLHFPDQETKLGEGKSAVRTDTGKALDVFALDEDNKRVELKLGPSQSALPDVVSLIPPGPRDDTVQRESIERYAAAVIAVIAGDAGKYSAITSILRREIPRVKGGIDIPAGADDKFLDVLDRGELLYCPPPAYGAKERLLRNVDAVRRMQNTHLVIQGPPGTGKTFTSAHAIVELLKRGKRVGVAAFTHKAINNLLRKVEEVAEERTVSFTGLKKYSDPGDKLNGRTIEDTSDTKVVANGGHQLVGGTAWAFARPEMDQRFDYLFIDEAGQVSLADVVAMGTSAKNIVLVGDQMQLSQPIKGAHPGGSGVSALDYLMQGRATVPRDRGILLATTWRMHPDLCRFVSQAFYDGRLEPDESTAKQRLMVESSDAIAPAGLRFSGVAHADNSQKSVEEAERLAEVYNQLRGAQWVDQKGETKTITVEDILVVSPYNMQVNLLLDTLPMGARVGTVDRFQGQEAAVVLVSMASSDGEHAPRGMTFLFSRERLNVAISRGRCLASVVASPALTAVACRTVEQLRLVNAMCWLQAWAHSRLVSLQPNGDAVGRPTS